MLGLAALVQPWNKKQAFQIRISDRGPRVPSPRGGGRNFACALSTENWVHVDRSQDAVLSVGQSESGWTREGRRDDKMAGNAGLSMCRVFRRVDDEMPSDGCEDLR